MNLIEVIQASLEGQLISLSNFVIDIIVTIFLSLFLEVAYVKLGNSSTKSRLYANNFMLLSVTTTLVITFIAAFASSESSVALALGLLGVLSVVRFRAAIKDPEELAYLFLAITIGLGAGIGLVRFTVIGFIIIIAALAARKIVYDRLASDSQKISKVFLTVRGDAPYDITVEDMVEQLEDYVERVKVKRFDEAEEGFEAEFRLWFFDMDDMIRGKDAVLEMHEGMTAAWRA